MSLMCDDIATFLVAQGVGTTAAPSPTIMVGRLEAKPDNAVCLTQRMGRRSVRAMGNTIVYDQPNLQVTARNVDSAASETVAVTVYALLDGKTGLINGVEYPYIEAMHPPEYVGIDENRRHLFTVNFHVRRRRTLP
ncbi:MAG: hypothetical protein E6R03_14895 [Hyphomicrobiaceae bacterium]|nr:MAG: hypothetical protein E6R03_14895 [Hyphomicrobiaceae bacterium]